MIALAKHEGKIEQSIGCSCRSLYLDPTLVKAAAEGRLPHGHGLSRLTDLPMVWPDQWRALGLRRIP